MHVAEGIAQSVKKTNDIKRNNGFQAEEDRRKRIEGGRLGRCEGEEEISRPNAYHLLPFTFSLYPFAYQLSTQSTRQTQ